MQTSTADLSHLHALELRLSNERMRLSAERNSTRRALRSVWIPTAAEMIHAFDPQLAALFLAQPFQRHNVVSALHATMSKMQTHKHVADIFAGALRSAIDQAQADATAT